MGKRMPRYACKVCGEPASYYHREGSAMTYTCEPHAVGPYRWNRVVPAPGEMDRHEIDLDAARAIEALERT
jgi:hypothetical protein